VHVGVAGQHGDPVAAHADLAQHAGDLGHGHLQVILTHRPGRVDHDGDRRERAAQARQDDATQRRRAARRPPVCVVDGTARPGDGLPHRAGEHAAPVNHRFEDLISPALPASGQRAPGALVRPHRLGGVTPQRSRFDRADCARAAVEVPVRRARVRTGAAVVHRLMRRYLRQVLLEQAAGRQPERLRLHPAVRQRQPVVEEVVVDLAVLREVDADPVALVSGREPFRAAVMIAQQVRDLVNPHSGQFRHAGCRDERG